MVCPASLMVAKGVECEGDHSTSSSAKIKKMYTFAPHYVFMMMLKPGRVLLFTISLDLQ
jgi:hypothetical protein